MGTGMGNLTRCMKLMTTNAIASGSVKFLSGFILNLLCYKTNLTPDALYTFQHYHKGLNESLVLFPGSFTVMC